MKRAHRDYLLLTIGILFIVFLVTHFTNIFGSDTDWINQHTIIPDYFRQIFYKTGNILPSFTFNYASGENLFNLSYYGLLSPIILISYLLPFVNMKDYIIVSGILIVIISTILFYKWLRNNNFDNNISLLSSFLFAFSCPLIYQMHRHIMFVNYMPFLIMSLMGVDRYIEDNKKLLLILGIFLMIMTSYYYSVCGLIVIGIYYIYKYLKKNNKIVFKDLFKFAGIVSIAILMSSILLLPTIYTIISGRSSASSTINILSLLIPRFRIHKIFYGTYAIGTGLIGFISLLYLIFIKKKHNLFLAILALVVLFIPLFMFLLNGGLYLREKCFIPFLPLIIFSVAYFIKDLINNKINIKYFVILSFITLGIFFLFDLKELCFILAFIFILILLIPNIKIRNTIIFIYLFLVSLGFCIGENFNEDYVSKEMYNDIFKSEIQTDILNVLNNDTSYYRFNNLVNPTKVVNKIYGNNYYTTNTYSSTYNNNYLNFIRETFKSNIIDYNNFLFSPPKNILFDTFMSVKYLYSNTNPGLGYTYMGNNIYKNENILPIIYFRNNILSEDEFNQYEYPYTEELLLKNVVVKDKTNNRQLSTIKKTDLDYEVITSNGIEYVKEDNGYKLIVENEGNLLLKLNKTLNNKILFINIYGLKSNTCRIDNIRMTINNIENILTCKTWPYPNYNNTFRYVISEDQIDYLNISLSKGEYNISKMDAYVMDYNELLDLKVTDFRIESISHNIIKGEISVGENGYLVTSIPYDKGFKVKVNGEIINYEMVNKGFIGFELSPGYYNIEFIYKAPLLDIGKMLSIVGLVAFGTIILKEFVIKRPN